MKSRLALVPLALTMLAAPALAQGQAFDVETATRAYLDTLQGAARAKSDAYFEGGYWVILWGALVSFLADALLLRFALSARLRDWAARRFKRTGMVVWATAALYVLWGMIVTFPWTVYTGFVRERQYGLMNQQFGGWLGDQATGAVISLVLMPLLITAPVA